MNDHQQEWKRMIAVDELVDLKHDFDQAADRVLNAETVDEFGDALALFSDAEKRIDQARKVISRMIAAACLCLTVLIPAVARAAEKVALIGDSTTQCYGEEIEPAEVAEVILRRAPRGSKYRRARVENFGHGATTTNGWINSADYCIPQWFDLGFPLMKNCDEDPALALIKRIPAKYKTAIIQLGINDLLRYRAFGETIDNTINNLIEMEVYWKSTRGEDATVIFVAPHAVDPHRVELAQHRENLVNAFPFDYEYANLPKRADGLHLQSRSCAMTGADVASLLMEIE